MSRLVVHALREQWQPCAACGHLIVPYTRMCEDLHLPCSPEGCIPPESAAPSKQEYDPVIQASGGELL